MSSSADWPDPPVRLIDVPASRDPSPDLLRRLREIDDRAEVIYIGRGRWWVGRVKTNSPRRAVGRRMALAIRQGDGHPFEIDGQSRWPELRQALLMAQGFGLVVDCTIQGEPDGRLVKEFAMAMHRERNGWSAGADPDPEELRLRQAQSERRTRDLELSKWLFRRSPYGRGNPWVGYGDNTPRRSLV